MSRDVLVLTGPMGAGKSSVGKRAAKRLGVPFTDTDAVLAKEHGPIPEIFRRHGEEHFRRLEEETVARSLEAGGIVALGGGAIVTDATRDRLRRLPTAFLTVSTDVVRGRIRGKGRPLLNGEEDPVARWTRIFEERLSLYREVADIEIDTSTGPLSAIVDALVTWAREDAWASEGEGGQA